MMNSPEIDEKGKTILLEKVDAFRWGKLYKDWTIELERGLSKDKKKFQTRLQFMRDAGFDPKTGSVEFAQQGKEQERYELKGSYGSYVVEKIPTFLSKKVQFHLDVARKYDQLYRSAHTRGKDFDLELKDVAMLLSSKKCYYTGVEFKNTKDLSLTVDRVDNAKGYVKGNVVACTRLANQVKNMLFEKPTNQLGVNIQFVSNVATAVLAKTKEDCLK